MRRPRPTRITPRTIQRLLIGSFDICNSLPNFLSKLNGCVPRPFSAASGGLAGYIEAPLRLRDVSSVHSIPFFYRGVEDTPVCSGLAVV